MARAKPREKRKVDPCGYDGKFAPRHEDVRDPDGEGKRQVRVERRIDRLEWLREGRHIEDLQFHAGRQLQRDWARGNSMVLSQISDTRGFSGSHKAENIVEARKSYEAALSSLAPRARRIVEILLLEDENYSLERAAQMIRENRKSALPLLKDGLDLLARHYGYA